MNARSPKRSATQVDPFERLVLKPGFHVIDARVETTWVLRRLSAVGQGESARAGGVPTEVVRRLLRLHARLGVGVELDQALVGPPLRSGTS
jgi:hypothetical protein